MNQMISTKTSPGLPMNNERYFEDGIIHNILSFPNDNSKIFNRIKPEHFNPGGFNKKIYSILLKLYNEFKPETISNQAIISEICNLLPAENKDWYYWYNVFIKEAPLPADIDFFINRLVRNYNRRRITEITNAANKRLEKGDSNESVADFTRGEFDKLESESIGNGPVCFYDVAMDCIETLETKDLSSLTGIKTLFTDIDNAILGLRSGDLVVVAGRPSHGKTTLATNIAINAAHQGYSGLIFSLEMSQYRLGIRMIASETGLNIYNLSRGKVDDFNKLVSIGEGLRNLYIDFGTGLTCYDVSNRVREFFESKKVDFIMLDYLQKLRFAGKDRRDLEVGDATVLFKNIAKEYEVPFVLLSQLSRANEKDGKSVRRPRLSDLRDSGSIEQDADIVIFIHRQEMYSDDPKYRNMADIALAKNRDGDTGKTKLTFRKSINKFENYTEDEY